MGALASIVDRSISGSFENEVTYIRPYTFYKCGYLTSASFPNAKRIGDSAFRNCPNLISASFPRVTYLEASIFINCSNLTTIYVGTETSTVCTLDGNSTFNYCAKLTNIYVPASLVNSYKSATNWSKYADKIKAAP